MKNKKRVVLDCDGVILAWYPHICKWFNKPIEILDNWVGDAWLTDAWNEIKDNEEFWRTIPSLIPPSHINFDFDAWLTHVPPNMIEARAYNLKKLGFPTKPIFTNESKLQCMIENDFDILVDDKYATIKDINDSYDHTRKMAFRFQPYYLDIQGEHIKDLRMVKYLIESKEYMHLVNNF